MHIKMPFPVPDRLFPAFIAQGPVPSVSQVRHDPVCAHDDQQDHGPEQGVRIRQLFGPRGSKSRDYRHGWIQSKLI